MYKLRLLYQGKQLSPVLNFSPQDLDSEEDMIPPDKRDLLLETRRQKKSLLDYEVAFYADAPNDSPLSGATMDEVSIALSYIADYYRLKRDTTLSTTLELKQKRIFGKLTWRMRRVVLLLLDFIGPKEMLNWWTRFFADSLIGKTKKEIAKALDFE